VGNSSAAIVALTKDDVNVFDGFGVTLAPAVGRASSLDDNGDNGDEDEDLDEHQSMLSILGSRLLQVKATKAEAYAVGSVDGAIASIARTGDITLAMDFFPVLTQT
jgi:hypothetical protein